VVFAFIDEHRARFGVEPMCRVLSEHGMRSAPSTYYAARTRPPSQRAVRDAVLLVEIRRVWSERRKGRRLYGARKVWNELRREGNPVARCTVERLMRANGIVGARRDKSFTTTRPDLRAARPPDLVQEWNSPRVTVAPCAPAALVAVASPAASANATPPVTTTL
jgi:putative transposase